MSFHSNSARTHRAPSLLSSSDRTLSQNETLTSNPASNAGDGFTEEERRVQTRLSIAADETWIPQQEYYDVDIADLMSGPGCRTFMGRVVNYHDQPCSSKMPRAAKGCVKMIVKDDTGVISVRLWYAQPPAPLRLGHLVTVWTPHISCGVHGNLAPQSAPLFTTIFPERDRGCHFMLHEKSDDGTLCKAPLEYRFGRPLRGLMTLQNFIDGGFDVVDVRILVVVKWIAAKKEVTTKRGDTNELVNVGLFDDTTEATLTLWGPMCASASSWKVSQTILLIANPGGRVDRGTWISLTSSTMVDVDPEIEDASWLRAFAERLTRREHVNPEFPKDIFDFESFMFSQLKIKYTLAELDEFARAGPLERFMGYMSVLITELNLVLLQRRHMLMCNECCGVPIFANAISTECRQCGKLVDLFINPRVLGILMDETGSTTGGKIIVSSQAWEQLFGRSTRDLVRLSLEALKTVEQRLLYLRLTIVFGWTAEETDVGVGRLCVWEIRS